MISIQKKKHLLSRKKGGVSMEILKLLLNNSDAIIISIIGAFIYDKLKIKNDDYKIENMK